MEQYARMFSLLLYLYVRSADKYMQLRFRSSQMMAPWMKNLRTLIKVKRIERVLWQRFPLHRTMVALMEWITMSAMGPIVIEGAIASAEVPRVGEVEERLVAKRFRAAVRGNSSSSSFHVASCLTNFRIPTSCPGDGLSTDYNQYSAFPIAESSLEAVKRRPKLTDLSVAHSLSPEKTKSLGGEAQQEKSKQRRAIPVST